MDNSSDNSKTLIEAARRQDFGGRAVIGTDTSGIVVYWNEQAAAIYRCSHEDAIGRRLVDVASELPPTTSERNIIAHMQDERGWTGEFMIRRADGTPLVMNVTTIAVHDGAQTIGTVGVLYLDSRQKADSSR